MPSANLDLVRSIYTAWERGDFGSTRWADSQIEFVLVDGPDPRSLKGVDTMATGWREFLTAWAEYRVQPDEYRDLGGDLVLVLVRAGGHGKASGVDLGLTGERGGANLFHITNGKVTRLFVYFNRDRALADLGLAPEDAAP
jgi:hypothetical protein